MRKDFVWPLPGAELTDGMLMLRPLRASDAEDVYQACLDERMQHFTQVPAQYTLDMAKEFSSEQTQVLRLALEHESFGSRYCGTIEARLEDPCIPELSLGYSTAPWARGYGLQTAAVRLITQYCFSLGVHRIVIQAAVDNTASRHVAESAGYQFEGIARHAENVKGRLVDLATYARLSTDESSSAV